MVQLSRTFILSRNGWVGSIETFVGLGLVGFEDNIKKNRRTLVFSFKIKGLI